GPARARDPRARARGAAHGRRSGDLRAPGRRLPAARGPPPRAALLRGGREPPAARERAAEPPREARAAASRARIPVTRTRSGPGRARALVAVLAVAPAASACGAPRGPRATPLPAAGLRPAALLDALARAGEARRSLRAVARLAIDGPAGGGRAKQILLLERPARLRVEVLGLLDQRVAVLTTDGAEYRLYRAADRSLTGGPVHDALLWEVAGLAVTPAQA